MRKGMSPVEPTLLQRGYISHSVGESAVSSPGEFISRLASLNDSEAASQGESGMQCKGFAVPK